MVGGGAKGCLVDGLVGGTATGLGAGGGTALLPRGATDGLGAVCVCGWMCVCV